MTSGGATRAILTGALALGIVLGLVFVVGGWLRELPYRGGPDYSAMPPSQAFEKIMGYPPPPGVTNLRVAGHAFWGMKFRAWMSFDVTDTALRSLLKEEYGKGIVGADATKYARSAGRPNFDPDAEAMRKVGWSEVEQIEKPEVYLLPSRSKYNFVWAGWFIVDRKRNRAYAQADGD